MKLLAIDTSTEKASLALSYEGRIYHQEHSLRSQHAQFILPCISSLFADAGIRLQDLDGIVFGQGPGSFTGIRIACTIAKGLAYSASLPLYPMSGLAAIANELRFQYPEFAESQVLAVIDASMNQLYWSLIAAGANNGSEEAQVSSAFDILASSSDTYPLILAGVGFNAYQTQLHQGVQARISQSVEVYPQAQAMLRMAESQNLVSVSVQEALPLYIRNQVTQAKER